MSDANYTHIRDYREWCQFLETQFQRRWKIHFAKKTKHARQNINYIGRYLKRPPMAASALRHYTGGTVVHHYYDHRTQQHRRQLLSQEEMLLRDISHIPSRHFKMVRYYGFLSNCVFRPKPTIDSDLIRSHFPICSGQIWPSIGIRDPGSGIRDRILGIGDPVIGIPRFSL